MRDEKLLNENVIRLDISCNTVEKLKENKITNLKQLCRKDRDDLQTIGIPGEEISKIESELQLIGLNIRNF